MIQVAYPWVFLAMFLPFIVRYLFPSVKNEQSSALKVPFFSQLQQTFAHGDSSGKPKALSSLKYLALLIWVLMVVSGAGIQWLGKPLTLPQSGRDLLMAIDLSGSMQTPDMQTSSGQTETRIDVVKRVANQFINGRTGDRLGLVLFGSRPYLQTPLTFDRKTVGQMLNDATLGIAGPQTAIGDAIGLSVKQFLNYPGDSKALVLLTDGGNNAGVMQPLAAAKLAAQEHIKIYTIGLGASQMVVPGIFGSRIVNHSDDLDIDSLKQIAQITGGEFFRAEDGAALSDIYARINQLEPVKSDAITIRPVTPLYPWTLGVALGLSFLLMIIRIWRR